MEITNDIAYIGVNDYDIKLFEAQYAVENGMAYNSYVITDDKIAVIDSVAAGFGEQWLSNIEKATGGKAPDYIIVQHMEPDHSANIKLFTEKYPNAAVVASAKAFAMMKQFFGTDFSDRQIIAGEKDALSLGKHTLTFITAPMVHWPEVIVTYDSCGKVLFSADGFGKFGTTDAKEDWACEARRYYFGIVGKYGAQVRNLLKKVSAYEIEKICPLHGPVLSDDIGYYINLYDTWSSYRPESDGVVIAYASVYGGTESAAKKLGEMLKENGCSKVVLTDLTHDDMAEAVEDAFRYNRLVLASATYNADVFPSMRNFILSLTERNFQNRTVAFIENGSWAPMAAKVMKQMLSEAKNLIFVEDEVHIKSALDSESTAQLEKLAKALV